MKRGTDLYRRTRFAVSRSRFQTCYRYNNENGPIIDSSGNGNDIANPRNTTREDGLFNLSFNGERLRMPLSASLDDIQDQLTVETFVFVDANDVENLGSPLVRRKGSFNLKINGSRLKPVFVIHTLDGTNQPVTTRVSETKGVRPFSRRQTYIYK
ncbi:hypothetical protein [Candidatus Uabimicrobium sp. HlEnr_7]|uniref:hypothetical protein n=1 Tax=Candidatus Uabimicrobium helgolandensis TaxID=3095367 RepID=UPI003557957F